jgi:hypothetical protein
MYEGNAHKLCHRHGAQLQRSPEDMAKALAEAEARAEARGAAKQKAKSDVQRYFLYVLQRQRIMRNCSRVCRSCDAWTSTHLSDFGY